ncbi:MAG: hypothetical protein NC110_08415 [Ruminococcus sp.]|nr:hypothetical protein [Ruminococcus sp.]
MQKNLRKPLSVFLAILMIVTGCSVSMFAFAAETARTTDAVAEVEAAIDEFNSLKSVSIAAAKPAITVTPDNKNYQTQVERAENYDKRIGLYADMIAKYKALSEDEKDAVEIQHALTLLKSTVEREAYLIKTDYDNALPEGSPASAKMQFVESRKQAQAKLNDYLGEHAVRDEAFAAAKNLITPYTGTLKLMASTDFAKYPQAVDALNAFIEDYKAASPLARKYMDGVNGTFESYSSDTMGATFALLAGALTKYKVTTTPFDGEKPATVSKPNYKNYPNGKTDPDYLKALAEWLPYGEASQKYTCDVYNYEAEKAIEAFEEIVQMAPEFKDVIDTMLALRNAYASFIKTNEVESAKEAVTMYEALSDYEKKCVNIGVKAYSYYYLNAAGDAYSYSNLTYTQLYKKCAETGGIAFVNEFIDYVNSIDLNEVNNDIVAQAQAKYNAIPSEFKANVTAEAREKYSAILALYDPVKPLTPLDYDFAEEIAAFKETKVSYECDRTTNAELNDAVAVVGDLANTVIKAVAGKDLTAVLSDSLYTNATMSTLLSLYNMIAEANLTVSGINVSSVLAGDLAPKKVAAFLSEEKFAGAVEKLNKFDSTADYASIAFENGDWGFEDGDQNGFANAMAAMLRPVANILKNGILVISEVLILNNSNASNGDYVYGAYEYLIPLLETIGAKGVLSSEEYSKQYFDAMTISANAGLDALLLPIINPVLNLVGEVAADPVNKGIELIGNVAYAIENDIISSSLNTALHTSSLLSGLNIDLGADAINNMITGAVSSIKVGSDVYSFNIDNINWSKLAHCGKLVKAESATAANSYRTALEVNKGNALYMIYYYVFNNFIGDKTNCNELKALIADNVSNKLLAGVAKLCLAMVRLMGATKVLCIILCHSHAGAAATVLKVFVTMFKVVSKIGNIFKR